MTGAGTARGTLFTPESANRALPYVRAVVEDLVEATARSKKSGRARRKPKGDEAAADDERRRADEEAARAKADCVRLLRELEAVGVVVKDSETGLIDFPGEIAGRRVLLCWRRGEDRVAHWHDLSSGFRGRRPIDPADSGSA